MKNTEHLLGSGVNPAGCLKCRKPIQKGRKFCSHSCYSQNKIGEKHPWGHKISEALTGKKKSADHVRKVTEANKGQIRESIRGEKHHAWKGDAVGYCALHDWVKRRKGNAESCSRCNFPSNVFHWANVSGEYRRDLSDWINLCVRCHSLLDRGRNSIKSTGIKY